MATLLRAETGELLIPRLRIADDLRSRTKGLLGTASIAADEGLWIHRCNSIHTFFMQYPIDCVFLDRKMVVRSVVRDVSAFRLVWPRLLATSVVEMRAGRAAELGIRKGERLNVGT